MRLDDDAEREPGQFLFAEARSGSESVTGITSRHDDPSFLETFFTIYFHSLNQERMVVPKVATAHAFPLLLACVMMSKSESMRKNVKAKRTLKRNSKEKERRVFNEDAVRRRSNRLSTE